MSKVLLLVNTYSRSGAQQRDEARELLEGMGFFVIAPDTESFDHEIAKYADVVDSVIVGGGDGTLNSVAAALVRHKLKLGILPMGTANDLSRTLNIPASLGEACKLIAAGNTRKINLGKVNGRYFFNVANIGLGVAVNQRLDKSLKRTFGALSYLFAALAVAFTQRPFFAEVSSDKKTKRFLTLQLAVGNGCFYGGGMKVHAKASIEDSLLRVYSIRPRRWLSMVLRSKSFVDGELHNIEGVEQMHDHSLTIKTRKPKIIMADGERLTSTPARFQVHTNALDVFVP